MKRENTERRLRVGLISLGCAKNLVDAEIMLGSLLQSGIEITNDAAQADALIVNTCSFIDSAQEESVDTILESDDLRAAKNKGQALIVSGCLPQRFREQLPRLFPEVDLFMGIDQVAQAGSLVEKAMAHRAERLAERGPGPAREASGPRAGKGTRLVELSSAESATADAGEVSMRGSGKFGRTKTQLAPPVNEPAGVSPPPVKKGETQLPVFDVHARPSYIPDYATPRFRLTPRHFAYVKIAEGCNHPCSFCIIPRMRGSHRSRLQADIVREAQQLLAEGVKELNLISQDSTYYGLDLRPHHSRAISSPEKFKEAARALPAEATTLCTLLRELNALPGDFWIRLLYTHPAHWTDELIRTMAECPKVARYVDMPLQHIDGAMLERMRRETSEQHIRELITRIRAGIPGIALRTTFIVGFPGETEKHFHRLLDFIRETQFERLGVFTYSKEDGTRAGGMQGQTSAATRRKRREMAMAAQHEVAVRVSESFVGKTLKVLVEGKASARDLDRARVFSWEHGLIRQPRAGEPPATIRNYAVARGEADAPDIDGRIYVRGKLPVGEFAPVRIVGHTDYDLIGEPA